MSKTTSLVTLRPADLYHAVAGREYQRLQARVDAQLGEDARHVVALGLGADVKPTGDLLGIEALGKSLQHLPFAIGEPRDGLLRLVLLLLASPGEAEKLNDILQRQQRLTRLEASYGFWPGSPAHQNVLNNPNAR